MKTYPALLCREGEEGSEVRVEPSSVFRSHDDKTPNHDTPVLLLTFS